MPVNLKISSVTLIPHKSKPYRCVLDFLFTFSLDGKTHPSVNSTTDPCAPSEAMVQLGKSVHKIIDNMAAQHETPRLFRFAKLDIKDGFWRDHVSNEDAWHFCYTSS